MGMAVVLATLAVLIVMAVAQAPAEAQAAQAKDRGTALSQEGAAVARVDGVKYNRNCTVPTVRYEQCGDSFTVPNGRAVKVRLDFREAGGGRVDVIFRKINGRNQVGAKVELSRTDGPYRTAWRNRTGRAVRIFATVASPQVRSFDCGLDIIVG